MSQVLALVSAVFYGFADFVGGTATRRLPVWKVTAWSQTMGLLVLALGFLIVPVDRITATDILWGAAAGVAGVIANVVTQITGIWR